jgi:hypothetical protein
MRCGALQPSRPCRWLARELPVQRTGDEDHAGAALPALLPLVEFTRRRIGRMAAFTALPMAPRNRIDRCKLLILNWRREWDSCPLAASHRRAAACLKTSRSANLACGEIGGESGIRTPEPPLESVSYRFHSARVAADASDAVAPCPPLPALRRTELWNTYGPSGHGVRPG